MVDASAPAALTGGLPMYDLPAAVAANDRFWEALVTALGAHGIAAPAERAAVRDFPAFWASPGLVLGQTCGFPLMLGRAGDAVPVARPVYAVEGCGRGTYRSALIARRDDQRAGLAAFQGAVAAVNEPVSQSGFNTFAAAVAEIHAGDAPFFAAARLSGSHAASAAAVARGEADIAAIDAVTFALLEPPLRAALRVIGWTAEAPALPFITAPAHADRLEDLRAALEQAIAATEPHPALPVAVLPATLGDYAPIAEMARRAAAIRFSAELAGPEIPHRTLG